MTPTSFAHDLQACGGCTIVTEWCTKIRLGCWYQTPDAAPDAMPDSLLSVPSTTPLMLTVANKNNPLVLYQSACRSNRDPPSPARLFFPYKHVCDTRIACCYLSAEKATFLCQNAPGTLDKIISTAGKRHLLIWHKPFKPQQHQRDNYQECQHLQVGCAPVALGWWPVPS